MKFTVSTGVVKANAYSKKMYRIVFTTLTKAGVQLSKEKIAAAVGELNKVLFETLSSLVKKDDAVRIMVAGRVEGGEIFWEYPSLQIEVFMRDPAAPREFRRILTRKKLIPYVSWKKISGGSDQEVYDFIDESGKTVGRLTVFLKQGATGVRFELFDSGRRRAYSAKLREGVSRSDPEELASYAMLFGVLE